MEFRHIRYFLAAAEELHFTRAAQRLNVAQPALSQQIKQLEDELGAQLFHRLTRGVELTDAGQAFRPYAQTALMSAEQGMSAAQRAAKGELGQLRIGFTSSASFNPIVTSSIGRFRDAYPDIDLELQEQVTTVLLQSLRDGRLQLAFARPADDEIEGLRSTPLPDEELWAALPINHRFAEKRHVDLGQLSAERFIVYPRTNGRHLYDAIIAACGKAGFSPRIVQEAPQLASTINLVASGVGIALVPASMRHISAPGVAYLKLERLNPVASMRLVQGPDLLMTPSVRNFIRCLEEAKRDAAAAK
ncbi:transcriptional regulator, LysR family (plasmid) [Rhizobium leguminosarum bv. trifolii WSM2304]|uniref:HTH-type transcriptional regulator TtuA n=1 Tax=Rhizobium leguminosarum bv. trifolii (strain WSM2304) TaxID=395492 RepID=A0ABF7QZ41_RHILW|nr:LysR family transcriptional regulator [Rhizobium leguminosarum]ACI59506.1 transcriptional regulator, LysR family [Rhizobium leguminosarum bv. trifolii WSM2304]